MSEQSVFGAVERREIDVAALRLDDVIAAGMTQHAGDAKAGAGPADGDHATLWQRPVRARKMLEVLLMHVGDRVADRAEVIDQCPSVDPQPRPGQGGSDGPRIVAQPDDVAGDWRRDRDTGGPGQGVAVALSKDLPGAVEAAVVRRHQRHRIAEGEHASSLDFGDREARVGAADVDRYDLQFKLRRL